jgi:hypothetical protein
MHIRYRVELEESERQYLGTIISGGTRAVRRSPGPEDLKPEA